MNATLGKRIASHRKRMGLTQDQLAEKLGITAQAVSKWENDLSCPDITVLPKLADIFRTTTDQLLGRDAPIPVCETEVVTESEPEQNGLAFDNGKIKFNWDSGKKDGIELACIILLTGILYLVTVLLAFDVSFWGILWPTALLVFGIFGLFPKFSVFRLGCALAGGAFLFSRFYPIHLQSGIVFAVLVLLFGLALLADALRKNKSPSFSANYTDEHGKVHKGNPRSNFDTDDKSFTYETAFGSAVQSVCMEQLQYGKISASFGEYTVDLSDVETVADGCRLDAECNFGELTIQVPRCFNVVPDSSTAFASFDIKGHPDSITQGTIYLSASINFGEITLCYI